MTDLRKDIEIKYVSQITPSVIRDFILLMEERGHTAGGVHGFYRSIKVWLKWIWNETDQESINPINKVKAPRVPREAIDGISKEDFNSLLDVCPKNTFYGIRNITILEILYDTGVRATELCNINVDDVSLFESWILIRQGKGRKPRLVMFGKKTRKQLRKWLSIRYKESSNALFIDKYGERIRYTTLRELMRRLSIKAGIYSQ